LENSDGCVPLGFVVIVRAPNKGKGCNGVGVLFKWLMVVAIGLVRLGLCGRLMRCKFRVEEFFPHREKTPKTNMLAKHVGKTCWPLVMDGDNRTIQRQRTRKIHALKNQSLLIPVPKYSTLFYFHRPNIN
jgi:hypothetical protein